MLKKLQLHFHTSFFLKIPRLLGEHPFVAFLGLLVIVFLISALVFYQYVFLVQEETGAELVVQTEFQQQAFQELIETWEERELLFQNARNIPRRNLFVPSTVLVSEEPEEELTEGEN